MSSEEFLKRVKDALNLEARVRFRVLKQIGFEALEKFKSSKKDLNVKDLNNYREIFGIVVKVPGISSKFQIALAKVTTQHLHLLGCDNPKIILKKSTTLKVNSSSIAVGDVFYSDEFLRDIDLINSGKAYFFNTDGDGIFNVQVRIVEAPEPVLTSKEYKNVMGGSPIVILNFPSGKLAIDDGIVSNKSINQIEVVVAPGNYKCQVFVFKFPTGDYSFYIVLAKCEDTALNKEKEIVTLFPDF